ncbi:MAG: glycosyltransferase [Candidatus Margulisiibacteriota bacterium]
MKYSVVIPLYNGAKLIEKTLDSVLAQTYKDYEVVLVNDGSPDNVGEVVNKFIGCHPETKFVYVEQKNKGLGGARNTAIRHACGDIMAILDQDDIWYPEKLSKVAMAYEKDPQAEIVSHNLYIRKNGKILGVFGSGPYEREMHRGLLFSGNCLATPAVTFKKKVLENVGYFSEDVAKVHLIEDYDLWMRMARAGYKFYFLRDILGEYTVHENNYTTSNYGRMYESELNVVSIHYKLLNKKPLDWYRFRSRKANMFLRMAYTKFFVAHSLREGLFCLVKALVNNPLIPLILFWKGIKKYAGKYHESK